MEQGEGQASQTPDIFSEHFYQIEGTEYGIRAPGIDQVAFFYNTTQEQRVALVNLQPYLIHDDTGLRLVDRREETAICVAHWKDILLEYVGYWCTEELREQAKRWLDRRSALKELDVNRLFSITYILENFSLNEEFCLFKLPKTGSKNSVVEGKGRNSIHTFLSFLGIVIVKSSDCKQAYRIELI